MEPLDVRRITADEWTALRAVRLESLTESPAAFLTSVDTESTRPEAEWRARTERTVMAFRGSRPVAVAGWVWRDDERGAELVGMWVAPAERGSGVAHRLIDTLRGLVPSDCPLELEVQPDNARAIRFYERYGFKRIGDPAIGVSEGTLLRMRLG